MSNYLFIFSSNGSFRIIFFGAGLDVAIGCTGAATTGWLVIGGKDTPGRTF